MRKFLWINLSDLSSLGAIGSFGSPLMLMLLDGDVLWDCAVYDRKGKLDACYVIVEADVSRCNAISDGLDMVFYHKTRRHLRTRITVKMPGCDGKWQFVPSGMIAVQKLPVGVSTRYPMTTADRTPMRYV